MDGLTLAVAVVAGLLIMALKPRQGLGVYFALLMLYPSSVAVSLGTAQFTAGRLVIIVLLLRAVLDRDVKERFRLGTLDFLVLGSLAWVTLALTIMAGLSILENRAGAFMDLGLPYLAARMIVREKEDLTAVAKWVALTVILTGTLGIVESFTKWSAWEWMRKYSFLPMPRVSDPRWGLHRASGAVGLHIAFGMCFVAFLPLLLMLRKEYGNWRPVANAAVLAAVVGTFSSMSSGPFLCFAIFCICMLFIYRPEFVKPALVVIGLMVLAAEIGSNRHFYYLLGYISMGGSTAWHRARLLELAVQNLPNYWLFGYGFKDPGWGLALAGRATTDVCDEYVLLAVKGGILATILFVAALATSIARLRNAYRTNPSPVVRDAAWYMGSMMIAIALALYSVGLLSAMGPIFYAMLGIAGAPVFDRMRYVARPRAAAGNGGVPRAAAGTRQF